MDKLTCRRTGPSSLITHVLAVQRLLEEQFILYVWKAWQNISAAWGMNLFHDWFAIHPLEVNLHVHFSKFSFQVWMSTKSVLAWNGARI